MSSDRLSALPLYVSTRASAQLTGASFMLMSAVCWISAGYDIGEVQTVFAIQDGLELDTLQRAAHSRAGSILNLAQIAASVLLAATFLPWLFHVRVNVRALGVRRLRHGREWAYVGFLVPVLNLFRPYQVVSEIWRGSDPSTNDPIAWQIAPAPRIVVGWWGCAIFFLAAESVSLLIFELASGLARIQLAYLLSLLAHVSAALSASFGYFLVVRLSRAQESKWRRYGNGRASVMTVGLEGVAA